MANIYIVKDYGEIKSYFIDRQKAMDYASRHDYTVECQATDDDLEKRGDAYCFVVELTIVRKCNDQEVTIYMNPLRTFSYNSKTNFINTNSTLNYDFNFKNEQLIIKKTVPCKADITFGDKIAIGESFRNKIETAFKSGASIIDILTMLRRKDASKW